MPAFPNRGIGGTHALSVLDHRNRRRAVGGIARGPRPCRAVASAACSKLRRSGRHRARARGGRVLFDGPRRTADPARRLYRRHHVARVHGGDPRRQPRQGRAHLFRVGGPRRPEDHRALAADRGAGNRRCLRRRDRPRAVPPRIAHLDRRRADVRQAVVRGIGLPRAAPRHRCVGRRPQQFRPAGGAAARRSSSRPASPSTACR